MPALDLRELAAIFLGGMAGALARSGLAEAFPSAPDHWPWVTFSVNIAGAAVLGYLVTRLQERLPVSSYRRPLLGTGVCGGLTTFSTLQLDLLHMLDHNHFWLAGLYAAATVAAGFCGIALGTAVVRRARLTW